MRRDANYGNAIVLIHRDPGAGEIYSLAAYLATASELFTRSGQLIAVDEEALDRNGRRLLTRQNRSGAFPTLVKIGSRCCCIS